MTSKCKTTNILQKLTDNNKKYCFNLTNDKYNLTFSSTFFIVLTRILSPLIS